MAERRPLALHMPDADALVPAEIAAALELKPAAMLTIVYAQWDNDKGVSDQISDLVGSLDHDRLYVRFHADPNPVEYARRIGGPEAWGRLCAQRMGQYYEQIARRGVRLHAILANEIDADYEGGLSPKNASDFYRRAMSEYAAKRPQDILHVPATTGAPATHRTYLERYQQDGWIRSDWWIDGHGYDGDLENVLNVLADVLPGHQYAITETNDLDDFGWPVELLHQQRASEIVYFTLNWARGGEGRVHPPTPDDAAKQMSLLRFPDRYQQFLALPTANPAPEPIPQPEPAPMPDYHAMTRAAAAAAGIDQDLFERQIGQECGWSLDVIECRRDSSAGARGIAQIVPRFHPGVDPCDPQAALTYAANLMASNVRTYGSYQKALIAYNWGPGNLGKWNGDPNTLPAETRHYLDVILGAGWPEPGGAPVTGIKLSDVLARARSRTGDPYVWDGEQPGGFDCSGLIKWAYNGALTSFTDAIYDETQRVETPAPGDIVLYQYSDPDQPGVKFPHTELFLSDTRVFGARFGVGVGEHDQLPRTKATRYYRRAPNVIVDTVDAPPAPVPSPEFSVGPGLLAAMQAHGDQAASDEIYVKSGSQDAWSEAMGRSGAVYRYLPATGAVHRYDPAA